MCSLGCNRLPFETVSLNSKIIPSEICSSRCDKLPFEMCSMNSKIIPCEMCSVNFDRIHCTSFHAREIFDYSTHIYLSVTSHPTYYL